MANGCLVIADADKIHEYVFSPRKLKLIRGGSSVQERLNRQALLVALTGLGHGNAHEDDGFFIHDTPSVEEGADWEVIYAGGGTVMCHFLERVKAEEFCREAHRIFYRQAGAATVTTAIADWQGCFKETLAAARAQFELAKAGGHRRIFSGHTPYWKTCESCGVGAAGLGANSLCRACKARSEAGGSESRFFRRVNAKLGHRLKEANDFEEVAGDEYLAMLYIDGDAMGEYIAKAGGPLKNDYRDLSKKVAMVVETGLVDACASIAARLPPNAIAPFEALLIGGDDAIMLVRASYAIDFLLKFDEAWQLDGVFYSAGVVWAHHHFPISQFLEHTEVMLRSAKRRRRVNSVDYRLVTESMATHEKGRKDDATTAKPYTIEDLRALQCGVREWKRKDVPANKINDLYRIAFEPEHQAEVDYAFLLSRLEHRDLVRDLIGDKLFNGVKTKAADAVELWSMIDAGNEPENGMAAQDPV